METTFFQIARQIWRLLILMQPDQLLIVVLNSYNHQLGLVIKRCRESFQVLDKYNGRISLVSMILIKWLRSKYDAGQMA